MRHTYKTPFSFDGENEVELSILYTMTSGTMSDSGPTYDCAGEPFEYPEVDVLGVMVDDRAATPGQWDQVVESERLYDEMMMNAADNIADERDAAAEYRRESRE
jgi:hypothetical protein